MCNKMATMRLILLPSILQEVHFCIFCRTEGKLPVIPVDSKDTVQSHSVNTVQRGFQRPFFQLRVICADTFRSAMGVHIQRNSHILSSVQNLSTPCTANGKDSRMSSLRTAWNHISPFNFRHQTSKQIQAQVNNQNSRTETACRDEWRFLIIPAMPNLLSSASSTSCHFRRH